MDYRIVFFCPDQHICYNLHTLEEKGVGGGITSRIRMAHALAERGHRVTAYVNCPRDENIRGVEYVHFSNIRSVEADIFIASTSGDGLDLSHLKNIAITTSLKILMVHGIHPPRGIRIQLFDLVYSLSNYVREIIIKHWKVPKNKIFVTHRGVKGEHFSSDNNPTPDRDPFSIVYSGHPSKGLDSAVKVFRILRETDRRHTLHIFGGNQLWGMDESRPVAENGVHYHGLVGQSQLARQLQRSGFCLNLQAREEPFGMTVIESMRAGCIVLASKVGAYPEIIEHGHNGFLIQGDPTLDQTQIEAARLITEIESNSGYCEYVRRNAENYPLDWKVIAQTWEEHWAWRLNSQRKKIDRSGGRCRRCGASLLRLADGIHCVGCGEYSRDLFS